MTFKKSLLVSELKRDIKEHIDNPIFITVLKLIFERELFLAKMLNFLLKFKNEELYMKQNINGKFFFKNFFKQ